MSSSSPKKKTKYPLDLRLLRASSKGELHEVIQLLEQGAKLAINKHGRSALHIACHRGFLDIVRILLQAGFNPDLEDDFGDTALHRAVVGQHEPIVRRLIDEACSVDRQNHLGDTALHEAARYGGHRLVQLLIKSNANVYALNKNKDSALHLACCNGHSRTVNLLLSNNAGNSLKNVQQDTPLHVAVRYSHLNCVKVLVKSACELNCVNKMGNTPLHIAAISENLPVTRYLIDSLVDCSVKNSEKKTALDIAKEHDNNGLTFMIMSGPRPKRHHHHRKKSSAASRRSRSVPRLDQQNFEEVFDGTTAPVAAAQSEERVPPTRENSFHQQHRPRKVVDRQRRKTCDLSSYMKDVHVNPYVVPQLHYLHRDKEGYICQSPVLNQLPNLNSEIVTQLTDSIQATQSNLQQSLQEVNKQLSQRIEDLRLETDYHLQALNKLQQERMNAEKTMCLHRIDQRARQERQVSDNMIRNKLQEWMFTRRNNNNVIDSPLRQSSPGPSSNNRGGTTMCYCDACYNLDPVNCQYKATPVSLSGSEKELKSIDSGVHDASHFLSSLC